MRNGASRDAECKAALLARTGLMVLLSKGVQLFGAVDRCSARSMPSSHLCSAATALVDTLASIFPVAWGLSHPREAHSRLHNSAGVVSSTRDGTEAHNGVQTTRRAFSGVRRSQIRGVVTLSGRSDAVDSLAQAVDSPAQAVDSPAQA
eukprot:7221422-Pyramimonas_sp.AAC.1